MALFLADLDHAEPRIVVIGSSPAERVLFVVSVEIEDDVLRIISARRATPGERASYEEGE
jgi:uncharacterized DUF497 family protein